LQNKEVLYAVTRMKDRVNDSCFELNITVTGHAVLVVISKILNSVGGGSPHFNSRHLFDFLKQERNIYSLLQAPSSGCPCDAGTRSYPRSVSFSNRSLARPVATRTSGFSFCGLPSQLRRRLSFASLASRLNNGVNTFAHYVSTRCVGIIRSRFNNDT
jgi:hypothetical protein